MVKKPSKKKEKDTESKIKAFECHGFIPKGESSGNVYGDCVFCQGTNKMYINKQNYLWDCKKCGLKGNLSVFLNNVSMLNAKSMTAISINKLCTDRNLPDEAFENMQLGKFGNYYTFPIRNEKGAVVDVRRYRIGKRILGTNCCSTYLFGAEKVVDTPPHVPVYICEGEWDTIALNWLLKKNEVEGLAVGVPGAGVFKNEWVKFFEGRDVIVCYDNDEAGEKGELVVAKKIGTLVNTIRFVHFPSSHKVGYDVRDHVGEVGYKGGKPKGCLKQLLGFVKSEPRIQDPTVVVVEKEHYDMEPKRYVTIKDVFEEFNKYLYLKSNDPIEVCLAVVLSTEIEGDPLWLFLVGSSGGGKTEFINAFKKFYKSYLVSSLTPQSLISGMGFKEGRDPSLIPKLNEKTLIVKDFTSIMSQRDSDKDAIFGALRDAYDGYCSKTFGTGERRYESHFSVLSGVTQDVYLLAEHYQSLGERFIKFGISDNMSHAYHEEMIDSAITNIGKEKVLRTGTSEVTKDLLLRLVKNYHVKNKQLPSLPDRIKYKIVGLAKFGAKMRGTVHRDKRQSDLIISKPHEEFGTRLGKQIAKLAYSLALVNERTEVDEHDYLICKKVMLDTISQRYEDIVRTFIKNCKHEDDTLSTAELAELSKYPLSTVRRMLADMHMLEIVERSGTPMKARWSLHGNLIHEIERAELYSSVDELERESWLKEEVHEMKSNNRKPKFTIKKRGKK